MVLHRSGWSLVWDPLGRTYFTVYGRTSCVRLLIVYNVISSKKLAHNALKCFVNKA